MAFDVDGAKKEGYSDSEIADYLSKQNSNFDVQGALKAGYSLKEIADHTSQSGGSENQKGTLDKAVDIANAVKAPFEKVGNAVGQALQPGMQVAQQAMQGTIPGMGMQAMNGIQNLFQKGGEAAAQTLPNGVSMAPGQQIKTSPEVAGAVGTGLAMTPQIAMAAQGIAEAPQAAQALSDMGSTAMSPLRRIATTMVGPGEAAQRVAGNAMMDTANAGVNTANDALSAAKQVPQDLASAKAELPQVQSRMAQLPSQREALVAKAGKNIQSLEAPLGSIDSEKIAQLTSDPAKASARVQKLQNIASKGSDYIANNMTASDIRLNRQFLQEVARNPAVKLEGAQASQLNTAFGEAMDKHIPGYKDALDVYKQAQTALEDVPNVKAQELGNLRSQIKDMETSFTNSKLSAQDAVKKAALNVKQITSKVNAMVDQGKLSDVYRQRLLYAIGGAGLAAGGKTLMGK